MNPNTLLFDNEITQFLYSNNNIISMILLRGDSEVLNVENNYIKRNNNQNNELSYISVSKIPETNEFFYDYFGESKNRITIKVGRFVNKILKKEAFEKFSINKKVIEEFVNAYKSYFECDIEKLCVVQGDDIKKWYLESNYSRKTHNNGSLWKSCMRQEERNKFLNIYSENEHIKMLILLDDDGDLRARALLWEEVYDMEGNKYKLMDRIYTIYDHDVNFFKKWAKENGYITKSEQNSKSETYFDIDGDSRYMRMKVILSKSSFKYYPYLDTFRYFDLEDGILYNYQRYSYLYRLDRSNGFLPNEEPEEEFQD